MAASNIALVLVLVLATSHAWEKLPSIPANRRAQYFLQHDDGAYKYGYDTGDGYSAQASADAANQVQGQYSYIDRDGKNVNLQYTAGDGGFVPVIGAASSGSSGTFGARSSGVSSRAHSVHSGVVPVATAYTGNSAVAIDADFDENADASYNFNIDTDSYKRTEVADAKGNIQGKYSYNSPVGGSHAISYIAGEGTGFVVTSDESTAPQQGYASASQKSSASSGYNYQAPQQSYLPPATSYAGASSDGQAKFNPDGSFAFSYTTSDHNHQAVADAQNNVRGSYSFTSADDGQTRKVDYIAGANTGYVATGNHLPLASAPSGGAGFKSAASHGASTFNQGSASHYSSAPAPTNYAAPSTNAGQSDGSYSFSYQTDDHSHHAASDPKGNVAGSFSYVAGDGVSRKIDYTAGADKGFVVKGAHLPVAPMASGAGGYSAQSSGNNYQASSGSVGGGYQYAAPAATGYSAGSDENSDGSYSYSYNTGVSSKQETADAKGNVAGTFSFLGGDGVNRKLSYTARADEGFVVKGDHLPVAPVAGSGHDVGVSGRSAFSGSANTRSGSNAQGSGSGSVMASKDGAYSYSYSTGGQNSGTAAFKSSGQNSFGSGVAKSYSAPVATGSSHGSSAGQVMASKDGAYSYSYSTGGQNSGAAAFKSSSFGQNTGSGAAKAYSAPVAAASSHGSSAGQVMASKDGEYSYTYAIGGQNSAAPSFKSSSSGHDSFGSGAVKAYSSPVSTSGSHGSSSGQVMASKDGAYSYSYSTGGSQSAPVAISSRTSAFNGGQSAHSAQAQGGGYAGASADEGGDASYSYSYKTDTHSKQETSDAKGNVVGSFTYLGGDGVNRKLSYTAKNEAGFNAAGDHLPVSPSVGSGSQSSSFGHQSGVQATAYSHPAAASRSSAHAHSQESRDGNVVISEYLPPAQKFGYIFDTKA